LVAANGLPDVLPVLDVLAGEQHLATRAGELTTKSAAKNKIRRK
jgi:hypothetical protein